MITKETLKEIPAHKQLFFMQKFYSLKDNFQNFTSVTTERRKKLQKQALEFRRDNEGLSSKQLYLLSFIALRDMDWSYDEKVLWLIEVNDPDFASLKICEENKKQLEEGKQKCMERFGFYSNAFIYYQKAYDLAFSKNISGVDLEGVYIKRQELCQILKELLQKKKRALFSNHSGNSRPLDTKELLLKREVDHSEYELRFLKRVKDNKVLPSKHPQDKHVIY